MGKRETGVIDKNGREVIEGDFVLYLNDIEWGMGQIYYNTIYLRFDIYFTVPKKEKCPFACFQCSSEIEVFEPIKIDIYNMSCLDVLAICNKILPEEKIESKRQIFAALDNGTLKIIYENYRTNSDEKKNIKLIRTELEKRQNNSPS